MSAEESLMPTSEGGKLPQSYNVESGDAKFVKGSENVDVQTSTKLIGLTKEQLEKYRHDPFWRPVRTVLFILFWAVWVAMFGGAIVIVVLSPKCDAKAAAKWDQVAVHYQLYTPAFRDSNDDGIGDFNGISEKMDLLRKIGVTSIWPVPIIQTNKNGFDVENVMDLEEVDGRYGTEEEFIAMVKLAHDKELKIVMDLPVSVSKQHKWNTDAKFVDFVAKPEPTSQEDFVRINLANPEARDAVIKSALKFVKLGVDAFHVNDDLLHGQTNVTALIEQRILSNEEMKEKKIIFFTSASKTVQHRNNDMLSYSLRSISDRNGGLCDGEASDLKCVRTALKAELNKPLPYIWKNGDVNAQRADQRIDSHPAEIQTLLTMIQMALPGPVQTYYGEELGLGSPAKNVHRNRGVMQWDATNHAGFTSQSEGVLFDTTNDFKNVNFESYYEDSRSPLRVYQKLAKLRGRTEVIQFGEMTVKYVNDLIVISRFVSGSSDPVFLLVVNLPVEGEGSTQTAVIDDTLVPGRPIDSADVVISSPTSKYESHTRVSLAEGLVLEPFQGVLLKF